MRLRLKRAIGHAHGATGGAVLRFAIVVCIMALAIIAIGETFRGDGADRATTHVPTANDPLVADLARCRDITAEQLAADNTCRRIWAENRRRFFTPSAPAARNSDIPPKTQDRVPTSTTPSLSDEAR
jgi:conjugative transfer region protein TrbK